ncbi:hypothetical protein [Chloroherpeton thalassium]|nr:hypothetical protein [Chloroherpeton thalassium]
MRWRDVARRPVDASPRGSEGHTLLLAILNAMKPPLGLWIATLRSQ